MTGLFQSARYVMRQLRRSPGFTAVVLITLTLGIGANTAIYSVVNAVPLRSLPYKESDRLAVLWQTDKETGENRNQLSYTDLEEYRTRNHTLQSIVAFGDWSAVFAEPGSPERIFGMLVGDGYFSLMGVTPLLGREFLPEDQVEGKDQVVILGYGLWRRFSVVLMALFGGLGLLLATVGVYGILSYMVAQRTSEIGIRMALGAGRWEVLSLVVGQELRLAGVGLLAGVLGALLLTRLMSRLLFNVSPSDPATFFGVAVLLGIVSLVAIYIPAGRAAKVDPIIALRCE
jgi:MacB-like periplasmic core domain/FtsX-like permease family